MVWKSKGRWKRWYYDVQIKRADGKDGWMDERILGHFFALSRLNWAGDNLDRTEKGHYDVQIMRCIKKVAL